MLKSIEEKINAYKKLSTKELGKLGELAFEKDCYLKGFKVSKACIEAYPYDYILDAYGKLYKIQVKTTINYDGERYRFSINKTSLVHGEWKSTKYTPKDIDYLYLYCPITEKRFFICSYNSNIIIRETKTKNSQIKNIHYSDECDFDKESLQLKEK